MNDDTHEVTAQALIVFTRILYKVLTVKYGGDRTLNELRVMNQIIHCSLDGRTCNVTSIHKITGIPMPTVSRCVAHLQSEGWLSERRDPDDGRKRIICLGPLSMELTSSEIDELAQWFADYRKNGMPADAD